MLYKIKDEITSESVYHHHTTTNNSNNNSSSSKSYQQLHKQHKDLTKGNTIPPPTTTANNNDTIMCNITVTTAANATPFHIIITFLNVVLIFIIVVGNSLTIRAVTKFRSLRHHSSVMMSFLAVSDLLMGVPYTPLILLRTHMPYLFKLEIPCMIFQYVGHFASVAAMVFLSMLSFERFYAIQFPFHYHAHATVKAAVVFNAVIFSIIALAMVPTVAGAANWYEGANCYAPTLYPSFYTRSVVAMGIIPLFLGFLAFLRVCFIEFRFRKQVSDQTATTLRKQESIRTKLIITAYVISLSFWTPHLAYYLYDSVTKQDQNVYVYRIVVLLDTTSSAVNCFLYAWKNSKFRAAYKELLCMKTAAEELGQTSNTVESISALH